MAEGLRNGGLCLDTKSLHQAISDTDVKGVSTATGRCCDKMLLGTKKREDEMGMHLFAVRSSLEYSEALTVQDLLQVPTAPVSTCFSRAIIPPMTGWD